MTPASGRPPQDQRRYRRDPRSEAAHSRLIDGCYVYMQDLDGTVYVLPDGPHAHVRVLGDARPALYAGDLTISRGQVVDLTNCSGTFQFSEAQGLLDIASRLEAAGLIVAPGAVRLFSHVDASRPVVLR